MSIEITSTTDSPEAVTAALGGLVKKGESNSGEKELSASDEAKEETEAKAQADETTEESETSEEENEAEGDEDSEDEKPQKPKKEGGFQRRIKKLTSKLSEAQAQAEYWREQALRGQKSDKDAMSVTETPELKQKPKPDDYETHEDYIEALADWKLEHKLAERDAEARKNQIKSEHDKILDAHLRRVEDFKKSHEDFDEVIEDVADMRLSLTVQEVILKSENGPELMYELAKDPDELERINKLPAIQAARELGKLEAKIVAQSKSPEEKKQQKITKAPPPPKPVSGKSEKTVKKSIYDPDISQEEYERLRMEMRRA